MKNLCLTLLAALLLIAAAASANAEDARIVIRVVSGDTIIVDGGQAVRMLGVIAPLGDEYMAKEARQFTTAQLLGQEVELITDSQNAVSGHKDAYGRKLAYIYRSNDKFFINAELIRQGLGYATMRNAPRFGTQFFTFQLEARKSRRGVWDKIEFSPEERAKAESRKYEDPPFEYKPEYKTPDLRVEIIWAKRADPRFRVARTAEEAKFLEQLYRDDKVGKGEVPLLVRLRQNLADELTSFFQKNGVELRVETAGTNAETLKFIAKGMDQDDADKFCAVPFNRELFAGLEFTEVIFTDGENFSFTYKVQ